MMKLPAAAGNKWKYMNTFLQTTQEIHQVI